MITERRKTERFTPTELIVVYDALTGRPLGTLASLSTDGAMMITSIPVPQTTILRCRVELKQPVLDSRDIHFKAECRWCRKNITLDRWESGYRLTASPDDSYRLSFLVLGYKLGQWGYHDMADVRTVELENRRKSVRFEFDCTLPVYDHDSYRQLGTLADLSLTGCRMITDKPIGKGDTIRCRIKLPLPALGQDFLILTLQCQWCRRLPDETRFESGHTLAVHSKQDAALVMHLLINHGKPQAEVRRIGVVPLQP